MWRRKRRRRRRRGNKKSKTYKTYDRFLARRTLYTWRLQMEHDVVARSSNLVGATGGCFQPRSFLKKEHLHLLYSFSVTFTLFLKTDTLWFLYHNLNITAWKTHIYYRAESVSGQVEVDPAAFWLATREEWAYGPILPAGDFPRWSRNKKSGQDAWILASVHQNAKWNLANIQPSWSITHVYRILYIAKYTPALHQKGCVPRSKEYKPYTAHENTANLL